MNQDELDNKFDKYFDDFYLPCPDEVRVEIKAFMHQRDEATRLQTLEEVEKVLTSIVDTRFPSGERRWCIECARRIKTHAITKLKGE
jgi:hypothetical protein